MRARASCVILVLGALGSARGWTGLEDEGSGQAATESNVNVVFGKNSEVTEANTNVEEAVMADGIVSEDVTEEKTNIEEAVVANGTVSEDGYVVDNANGDPPPPEPTPIDFIDPADFFGPQGLANLFQDNDAEEEVDVTP